MKFVTYRSRDLWIKKRSFVTAIAVGIVIGVLATLAIGFLAGAILLPTPKPTPSPTPTPMPTLIPEPAPASTPIYIAAFNYEDLFLWTGGGIVADGVLTHLTGVSLTFWYGPYASLAKGNYSARFWLRLDKAYNGTLLNIDVLTDPSKNPLTFLTLSSSNFEEVGKWESFDVKFTLKSDTNGVEFRGVRVREAAPISLALIELYSDTGLTTQPIPKIVFSIEDLIVDQGTISNGIITHTEGNGTFWSGPYVSLPRGNYIANYTLRLDKSYDGVLLDLDVSTNAGKDVITFLTVSGSNFREVNKWQSFEIEFTLEDDMNDIEFRGVLVRETAPISLRSIELYSNNM